MAWPPAPWPSARWRCCTSDPQGRGARRLPDADVDAARPVHIGPRLDDGVGHGRAPAAGGEPVEQALAHQLALDRPARIGPEVHLLARIRLEVEQLRAEPLPVDVLPAR